MTTPPFAFLGLFGQAWEFIVDGRQAEIGTLEVGGPTQVVDLASTQLEVSLLALGAALILALPAGLALGHFARGEFLAVSMGNAGRALPELALIALMAAAIGVGMVNLIVALAILGIPPILTNAYVAIRQVDDSVVEAAQGMGMGNFGVLTRVELPLAVPTVMAGIRTAAVNIVATATIAPLAGILTLGDFILARNVYGEAGVLAGAVLVALMALTFEALLAGLQWTLTPRSLRTNRFS